MSLLGNALAKVKLRVKQTAGLFPLPSIQAVRLVAVATTAPLDTPHPSRVRTDGLGVR